MKTAKTRTPERVVSAPPAPKPSPLDSLWIAAAAYFGLAVIYFFPAFLPGNHIYGTDYLVGGYFFHEFISQRFTDGVLPKWVPYVYGGLPLFANPGSTFYPFRFVADAIFHTSRIWPTLFVIHFTIAGIGMYLLARELGARGWVAFLGGLGFQFTGLTMSWVLAGHEGRIIVATFAPLVFFCYHRGIRTGETGPFVLAAAALGFSLLSFQIQVAYYLLLAALLWSVYVLWHLGLIRQPRALIRPLVFGLGSVAFAFMLASVNFLPFLEYVEASPRGGEGGRGYEYSTSWSMPPREITAVAVPEDVGYLETYRGENPFKLHVEYVGVSVVALLALGFAVMRRNPYWWFFLGLAVFGLTIAFGGHTPIYRLYYELLPGTQRFRAPSISFFLVSMSFVAMATLTLETLAKRREAVASGRPDSFSPVVSDGVLLGILAGVVALIGLGFLAQAGGLDAVDPAARARATGFGRTLIFALIVAALLGSWLRERLATLAFVIALAIVTVADLWIVDRRFFDTVPGPEEMFAADDVVRFLQAQPERSRAWILPLPSGAIYRGQVGNYLMRFNLDQVAGEHGNQLQRFNQYLGAGEEVYVDWHNFLADIAVVQTAQGQALQFRSAEGFLEAANVRHIISMVPLANPELREVHRGSALVYEHTGALPRAYVVPRAEVIGRDESALARMQTDWNPREVAVVANDGPVGIGPEPAPGAGYSEAQILEYEPDRVLVRAQRDAPGLLVLADNYYHRGWIAEVNGERREVLRANHTFRGVVVDAGDNLVEFRFEPADVRIGFVVYLIGMGLLLAYAVGWLMVRIRRRTQAATPA